MTFNSIKSVTVSREPLDFITAFHVYILCIDTPEDGLNTG